MQPFKSNTEIILPKRTILLVLSILPVCFLILAFIVDTPKNIFSGLASIVTSSGVLLTDYLEVGGLGASLVNVSFIGLANIFIIYKLDMRITGGVVAAIYTVMGFSFLGKSIFNIWPIYLGGLLYSRYHGTSYTNIIVVIIFATCLSPAVSQLVFFSGLPLYGGLALGLLTGLVIGFIITPIATNMSKAHGGHNLYNVGFTAGVLGIIINAVMKAFNLDIERFSTFSNEYDIFFRIALIVYLLLLIALGFIINNKSFKGYGKILNTSGKMVSDYTQLAGLGLTFINMGIMGFIAMAFVYLAGGILNGPIIGGVLTLTGFAAFGNHPKNSLPVMIGVFLCGIISVWDLQSTAVIIAIIFGTTLAPIAGNYGFLAGLLAGFLHLAVVSNVGGVHGGLNLYNNGFAGGIVASILFPLFESFRKEK